MATQKRSIPSAEIAKAETARTIADIFDSNYQLSAFDPPIINGGSGGQVDSIVAGDGIIVDATDPVNPIVSTSGLDSIIFVNQANATTTLGGVIDSTKQYFLDGVVDMGSTIITVPSAGITLQGLDFNISKLISSEAGYTLFNSPVGGSGGFLAKNLAIEITGAGSQVFNLLADVGFEAVEFNDVNFNDCNSLGTIDGYAQGLETGTGRFGGTPTLTFAGTWSGGYFIDTSIVRGLSAGMTTALYSAGVGFTMSSRFRSNQNVDLPASASLLDFSAVNFLNFSILQLTGVLITRNGVIDPTDTNYTPNITPAEIASSWHANVGLLNTFEGASANLTVEVETVINTSGVFETMLGTWVASDLQHFDSPANGQLRHIGTSPRAYKLLAGLAITGPSDNSVTVRIRIWDDSTSSFFTGCSQVRVINPFSGPRDAAFYTIFCNVVLDRNDYLFFEVANDSGTGNLTLELDSLMSIEAR